ncbi:hypothetical protein [Paramuribaculum intestinale]|uniref:hypothetical protein n=1 Tax=Paramuribaculum intestinale TaxID=2094151 RepID=UPI0026F2F3BB|nr:hypothetical protein [Paramuribaculum intestinale]
MRKLIFTAIAEKLLTVPGIDYVDLWNDNGAHFAGGAVYPLPSVFVEFETIEWHQQNNRARRADINVRLHILSRANSALHGSQDPAMAEALQRFDLLNSINAAMQGLRGDNFAGFMHTISATNHAHAEIIEDVECFRTSVQDTTAMHPVSLAQGLNMAVK